MISLKSILLEALSGIHPQCLTLMGLPASGKSTFINNELKSYFPELSSYHVINSDNQVKALQYKTALNDWNVFTDLYKIKNNKQIQEEFESIVDSMQYSDNSNVLQKIKVNWNWFIQNKDENISKTFNEYFKNNKHYYSNYFDIRDLAKQESENIFQSKIKNIGNNIIMDTVGAYPDAILKKFKETKEKDYLNSIIYLDIDYKLCIVRDEYRKTKSKEGRGVGVSVIKNYNSQMEGAYSTYKSEITKKDSLIDKLYHFNWQPAGDSPINGKWILKDKQISKNNLK